MVFQMSNIDKKFHINHQKSTFSNVLNISLSIYIYIYIDVMSESVSRNTTLALDGCKVVYWKMCMAAQAAGDTKPCEHTDKYKVPFG